jgi:hypothetical protein
VLLRGGTDATKARLHRLLWLFRRYRISVAVLRKPVASPASPAGDAQQVRPSGSAPVFRRRRRA